MSDAYRVAPIFLIRMTGVPFELVECLGTEETILAARELKAQKEKLEKVTVDTEDFFRSSERLLSEKAFRALLAAVRSGREPAFVEGEQPPAFTNYAAAATAVASANSKLDAALEHDVDRVRAALVQSASEVLPRTLIFGSDSVRELLAKLTYPSDQALPRRNAKAGDRERHLLLYLQRVCTKNDTFSEFGPSGWGNIDKQVPGVRFAPTPGITKREAFLERWTAHAVAAVMNADPDKPDGKIEIPALDPHAFEILLEEVEKGPQGSWRDKWLLILQPIAELPQKFIASTETAARCEILDETRTRLRSVGAERKASERFLYAAINPIGEECFRECNFAINEQLINEIAIEAEPWIDLWRDSYAFIASRVATGLRQIMEKAGTENGVMPLPAFLQACEVAKLPLTGSGLVALAVMAFQEVKAAFRERFRPHFDLSEYELTADDCHFVRNNFQYPKFDEYTYPSADLQIAAKSPEGVASGNYQWIIGELHPPAALLHHCMYWSCPDKAVLNEAFSCSAGGKPNFHFGFFAADFTAHTTVRIFDAIPELTYFVAPQSGNPRWKTVPPSEAEVFVDEQSGDVCLQKRGSHEYLGSFARAWVIPLGFHPFNFGSAPHMPRLRCGKVIVQRRSWTVVQAELGEGNFAGISRDLVLALDRLRAAREWPRYVYIRPTEQALRRSGVEGRDKDTKPVFIDFESYLFLEIFHRWLTKAGELEVTEMLPDPDHLLWKEADGRWTFELRTLILPRT